jgi:hypothetical protein
MPDTAWPIHGHPPDSIPGSGTQPGSDAIFKISTPQTAVVSLIPTWRLKDAFSTSLTTTVFSQRSTWWFETIPHRTIPKDRGRDRRYQRPPARIPACASNALGSSLGFWRQSARLARDEGSGVGVAIDQRGDGFSPR